MSFQEFQQLFEPNIFFSNSDHFHNCNILKQFQRFHGLIHQIDHINKIFNGIDAISTILTMFWTISQNFNEFF